MSTSQNMITAESVKTGFKLLGSLFCIVMIVIVLTRTDDEDHKGLNSVIAFTQVAMLVLLWGAPCGHYGGIPYIGWAWILLYAVSSICVGFRFKSEKTKKLKWAFIIGNAVLASISLVVTKCPLLEPFRKTKERVKFLARKMEDDSTRNRGKINFVDSAEYIRLMEDLNKKGQGEWVRNFKLK